MARALDITGQRFGRLAALSVQTKVGCITHRWEFLCDCGTRKVIAKGDAISGHTQSCGCLRKEQTAKNRTTHGMCRTKIYKTWYGIKQRCTKPYEPGYKYYGGRGIKMCDRWLNSFENFYADMGDTPKGMQIDRVDNNGDYAPDNCRWIDPMVNCQNRRNTKLNTEAVKVIRYMNKYHGTSVKKLAETYNIKDCTIRAALIGKTWKNVHI